MIKKFTQSFEDILLIIALSIFFILWDYKIYSIVDSRSIIILPIIYYLLKKSFNIKIFNLPNIYRILFFSVFFHFILNAFFNNYNLINAEYLKVFLGFFFLLLLSLFYKKKILKNLDYIVIFSLFIFSVSLLFSDIQRTDPVSFTNYINCHFFNYKFVNKLIFKENSHLAMVIPVLFFYLFFKNNENYSLKNILIILYYIFILFAFPSTTLIVNTIILISIYFFLDYKKFFKKFFLFLIIMSVLFFVVVVKKCNFKILNLKESISDSINIQSDSINIQNDLKKNELNDYLFYKEKMYAKYNALPIQESFYKDFTVAVYVNSLKISVATLQDHFFGYGINNYEKAFINYMGTKVIPPYREIYFLNYNDGSNNFAKLIVEFGIFSFFIIFLYFKYFFNICADKNNKFFMLGLITIQFFRGAGYFNGGFLLILIFIITDLYEKK
jgi:hypothetical protein